MILSPIYETDLSTGNFCNIRKSRRSSNVMACVVSEIFSRGYKSFNISNRRAGYFKYMYVKATDRNQN